MMIKAGKMILASLVCLGVALTGSLALALETGTVAPDFSLSDAKGEGHRLSDYQGKIVVLEWVNFDCPFVKKHYESGHMQMLQKKYTEQGVIWLSVNSSAPGKQGYFQGQELHQRLEKEHFAGSFYLSDADGAVGRLYEAKTTPHMYVIDPQGVLVYQGAIDNDPVVFGGDPARAQNYVRVVVDALLRGETSPVGQSAPYGCSVKY